MAEPMYLIVITATKFKHIYAKKKLCHIVMFKNKQIVTIHSQYTQTHNWPHGKKHRK